MHRLNNWNIGSTLLLLSTVELLTSGCIEGEIRLVGVDQSDTLGRVEVCRDGVFGTICDNDWDGRDASVVCSQLGLPTAGARPWPLGSGERNQPIHYNRVSCTGTESRLNNCLLQNHTVSDKCTHINDAGVICTGRRQCNRGVRISRMNLKCPNEDQCLSKRRFCREIRTHCSILDNNELSSIDCVNRLFNCNNGKRIRFNAMCDGIDHCGNGEDERSRFCADKCRLPFRGGCPATRECINTDIGPLCGECLGDLVNDPNNPGGECVPFAVSFTGGTPFLHGNSITIEFTANAPMESAICTFISNTTGSLSGSDQSGESGSSDDQSNLNSNSTFPDVDSDLSGGSNIIYSNSCYKSESSFAPSNVGAVTVPVSLPDFPVTIVVNATVVDISFNITYNVSVVTTLNGGGPGTCVVNLVNEGVTISGTTVLLSFRPAVNSGSGQISSDLEMFDHSCHRSDKTQCTCPCGYGPIDISSLVTGSQAHSSYPPFFAHTFVFLSNGDQCVEVEAQSDVCDHSVVLQVCFSI